VKEFSGKQKSSALLKELWCLYENLS
jgi:hypothetical protein